MRAKDIRIGELYAVSNTVVTADHRPAVDLVACVRVCGQPSRGMWMCERVDHPASNPAAFNWKHANGTQMQFESRDIFSGWEEWLSEREMLLAVTRANQQRLRAAEAQRDQLLDRLSELGVDIDNDAGVDVRPRRWGQRHEPVEYSVSCALTADALALALGMEFTHEAAAPPATAREALGL